MPNRESTMPFFALRPFLLSLVIAAGPTLLAGRLPLTNARIPWCALMEMGYPDPDLEAWRVLPSLAAPLLLDGTVTPVEAKDLVESSLARRLEDELVASHLYQSAIYRQQVDLLNESFDLGEVEDGSQGAVRRAEIEARLEQLETELEAHLRAGLAPSEKRLLQLGLLKEATEKALAAAAGNPERRARAQKNLRAAANRLRLAQDIHTALAARIPEAPWQDWRDGFGFKAVPEGVVLCLPGSWNPSLGGDARIIGYHHSRPGEPDSLIRLRMLRGIREQQDLVTFGVAEMDARRQRAADQAVRASAEQAKLEAEAELKRSEQAALEAERMAWRNERARLRAEASESKLERLIQSVRDLEADAGRQKLAEEAEAREWASELERRKEAVEGKREWREFAKTATPWSNQASEPEAEPSTSSSSETLPVDWHPEAETYDLNKHVSDDTTLEAILASVDMLRTGRLLGLPVAGAAGIYELRPCGGQSTWRPLYVRHGERFVIVALTREALKNPSKFAAGVKRAQRRAAALPPPPA
jgi:hypothetical protein